MHPRQSLTLQEAADLVSTSIATINRMVESGQLEGHYLRRQRRIYADSLAIYQERSAIKPKMDAPAAPMRRRVTPRLGMTDAARALAKFGVY